MDKKQLAEMIKVLRKKKLDEVIGKPEKFDPRFKATHPTDPTSPNQGMKEEKLDEIIGPTHAASLVKRTGVISKMPSSRKAYQGGNQKRSINSYKEEVELGATDTGKKSKADTETITVNPKDSTNLAKGNPDKVTTVKETKEK